MEIKSYIWIITTLVVIILAITAGCTSPTGPTQASPNQLPSQTPYKNAAERQSSWYTTQTTLGQSKSVANYQSQNDFSQVTHAEVSTIHGHWSSGAEYDGISVHPSLRDVKGQDITWSGVNLPVEIEIYTTKFDTSYKEVKDKLVYKGTGTISNWQDGNMFMGGGIQVPFSSMNVPAGETYGWTYVTIHMPNGKTFSAKEQFTSLTP